MSVAPYLGAWIEIFIGLRSAKNDLVAPYLGAWIEIRKGYDTPIPDPSRSLLGGVD